MERVLVIGASGRVGRHVVTQLASAGVRTRALYRTPPASEPAPGVELVQADLTDPRSMEPCLEGADSIFLVWDAPAATARAATERMAKHSPRIVFLSSPHTIAHPFFQRAQPNPISLLHAEIEHLIDQSGCERVFLRPGMFAGNALWWWADQIRQGDVVRWPYGDAPTAPVDERDIAAVAVKALCGAPNCDFEQLLTGRQPLTHRDQVAMIGEVTGRSLRYEEMPPDEFANAFPAGPAQMLLKAWRGAMEAPPLVTSAVAEITGRPPRTFREWAFDHASHFRPPPH